MTASEIDVGTLSITAPCTSTRGLRTTRTAHVVADAPNLSVWAPGVFEVAFEPRPFLGSESSKVNLVLRAGEEWAAKLDLVDAWATKYITAHSERLLGKAASFEEVQAKYTPLLKTSDRFPPTFKVKMTPHTGRGAVYVWTAEGERREAPESWMGHTIRPILSLSMWFMPTSFGLSFNMTDAIVAQVPPRAFPF